MARKSNAQIQREADARAMEISTLAEEKVKALLPSIVAGLTVELAKMRGDLGPAAAPLTAGSKTETAALLEGLAHAMSKAADPGNKRRILAPEIVQERALAREEMKRSILKHHAAGVVPVYRVIRPTFLNDTLIDPQYADPVSKAMLDQEVDWAGVPNQAMLPMNDAAQEIFAFYLKTIGAKPGHVISGFKIEGGEVQDAYTAHNDLDAPMVLTGKGEIRRGHAGVVGAVAVSDALAADPRRMSPAAKPMTQNVLGTRAQPAVIS
jgi:hypothetical protein